MERTATEFAAEGEFGADIECFYHSEEKGRRRTSKSVLSIDYILLRVYSIGIY